MPETRSLVWFRRAALARHRACARSWSSSAPGCGSRTRDSAVPTGPAATATFIRAQVVDRAAEINAANPDRPFDYQKAINEMVHRYIVGALGILVLGLARALGLEPPRPGPAARAALGDRRAAGVPGAARHVDRHAPAETAHRHAALAGRARDARAALVARAAAGSARAESGGTAGAPARDRGIAGADRAGLARRMDQHELRRRGLPGFPHLPGLVLAGHGLQEWLRAVARARHRL